MKAKTIKFNGAPSFNNLIASETFLENFGTKYPQVKKEKSKER